jgi:hypothetical protein
VSEGRVTEGAGDEREVDASPRLSRAGRWRQSFREMGSGERTGWVILVALLLALAWLALSAGPQPLTGDEPTYVLQAASLAWDGDLAFTRADHDRHVAQWGEPPAGVILQSRAGGEGGRITYAKPFLYALLAAPFVRLAPVAGLPLLNTLLLAAAALAATRALRPRLGPATPLLIAVLLFASVAFAYVPRRQADVLLLVCTVLGYALIFGQRAGRAAHEPLPDVWDGGDASSGHRPSRLLLRWTAAGALLAVPAAFRPFYLMLFLPAALAIPTSTTAGRRAPRLLGLAAGALAVLAATALVQWAAGGNWSPYLGERMAFFPRTGFPGVDVPASQWPDLLLVWGGNTWEPGGPQLDLRPDPLLLGWNLLYLLAGRTVGLLPYFLPVLLLLTANPARHSGPAPLGPTGLQSRRARWAIPIAAALALLAFLLVRPFDLAGGASAIANRYALPLYGAFWFFAARPIRTAPALLVAALAGPFLWPLWTDPVSPPLQAGRPHWVSPLARFLPIETTQAGPGAPVLVQEGIAARPLDANAWLGPPGSRRPVHLMGDGRAGLLLGSREPMAAVLLDFAPEAPTRLEVNGTVLRPSLLRGDGSLVFRVPLGRQRARHPAAWSREPVRFYALDLRLQGARPVPIGFRVEPPRDGPEGGDGSGRPGDEGLNGLRRSGG